MAVAFEGFSIREFASKMRSIDVVKSWPFDGGDLDREQIQSSLPPITVAKFRWWQHELEAARSSQASSSNAANLEEEVIEKLESQFGCTVCGGFKTSAIEIAAENCERQQSTRARSKTKAPKKRSIVEIFAVAPPIDTVSRLEGSSDGRNSDSARVKMKMKKKKNAVLKKRRLPILDRKLKKKVRLNSSFAIKEIGHKLKRKTASDLSRNFDRLRDKVCITLDDADRIMSRRIPSCKPASSHKKHKNSAPSNLISKKHKAAVSSVRGILKKPGKSCASGGQDTAFTVPGISQESSRVAADQSGKHVRFLVEKDKVDGKADNHAVIQQSNVHEILSGMDRLGRNEVESVSGDVTGCDTEISNCVDNRKELQAATEKETLRDRGNLKNLEVSFQEFLNSLPPVVSTSPNHTIPKFNGDLNNASTKGKSIISDDSRFLSASRGTRHGACSNFEVAGSTVRPGGSFSSSEFINHAVYGVSSVPRTNPSLQSMISDSSFLPPLYRPTSRPHQMNLIGGSFSFNEWRPGSATSIGKSVNDNLYGLPLNSRGGLIQSSSNGMLDQQSGPSGCLPLPCQTAVQQRNAEDSFRLKGNHTDERPRPKDLNLFPGGTITDFSQENSSHLFGTDLNLMSPYPDQVHHGKGKTEATTAPMTMRLMGKDVSVGGSEDEKVWTDKEIIVEHNPSGTARGIKNFFPQDQILHPAPEKPRGLVNISFGYQNNTEYYRFPHRAPEPLVVRDPYINWQPDATVQTGRVPITRNGTIFHIENRNERVGFGSQLDLPFSTPHEGSWIDIQWGGAEPRFSQNVPIPRAAPSFGFPPDCRECLQESRSRNNSFKEVPAPWLLHANRPLPPFPDRQHLYGVRANRWPSSTTQPTFHFPEQACCPYNLAAVRPLSEPVSAFGFRDHAKASKRPGAAVDVDMRKPPHKMPSLELQEHPRIGLCLSTEDIGRNVECSRAVLELDLHKGKDTNIGLGVLERNLRTSTDKPGTGPTKLSAGVKHILKPCQNTDKGNSRPTHSTIPFAGVNTK